MKVPTLLNGRVWPPVLFLLVSAPLLAEVLSGATSLIGFLAPGTFAAYVLVLYGIPVLVIREVAVRARIGLPGLFCLGMVYGLYNEGLLTESLYHPLGVQDDTWAAYGLVAGLRIPWLVFIVPWHGLFSVLTPILLTEHVFTRQAGRPWLPLPVTWVLGVLVAALGAGRFLIIGEDVRTQPVSTFAVHAVVVLGAAVALCAVAAVARRSARPDPAAGAGRPRWAAGLGAVVFVALFLVLQLLALSRVPWPSLPAYCAVAGGGALWWAVRRGPIGPRDAVAFVLGAGLAQAVLAVLFGALTGNPLWAAAGVLFGAAFVVLLAYGTGAIRRG
ncbi:hypothetical protein [Nonomuraea sp. NPDC049725]|uniref:hypothetical protein n=1 Tax=Nonomuraea sp. NPDC049725 TaxID=3154508 RepID=UPI00341B356C